MGRGYEAAEEVLVQVLEAHAEQGDHGVYMLDMIEEAKEIQVEPSRAHKIGNAILDLYGFKPRPYKPLDVGRIYPLLAKLEVNGVVESEWDEGKTNSDGKLIRRRLYRLASSNIQE